MANPFVLSKANREMAMGRKRAIQSVRRSARNVKYWQNGEMCLRWTAAGMLEAEQQFRRIIGYRDSLRRLGLAVNERHLVTGNASTASG